MEEKYKYNKEEFDLFALSNIRNEKYMATKRIRIYAFENDEYCFMKYYKSLNEDSLGKIIDILKISINDYIKPHDEHMSSTITGILAVDNIEDSDIIKKVKKFHYQKSFALGFKGWVDVRLVLVDLNRKDVITSKRAKGVEKFYLP
ncbi:MAG: hypothetical protein MJA82_09870 [Clostridia bacterium]|nr:hypothetical protein [Clostridia bacterium]